MSALQSAELLGVSIAALLVSVLWGDSPSVRNLCVIAAVVSTIGYLSSLQRLPSRSKLTEDELTEEPAPSSAMGAIAGASASVCAAVASMRAAYDNVSTYLHSSTLLQVATICSTALLSSCLVKAFGIPGHPWNQLVIGAGCAWCLRKHAPVGWQQKDGGLCPCGEHNVDDDTCPYHSNFWPEVSPETDDCETVSHEEEEGGDVEEENELEMAEKEAMEEFVESELEAMTSDQ